MVIKLLLDIILFIPSILINALGGIFTISNVEISMESLQNFASILKFVGYVLPVGPIFTCLGIVSFFEILRIGVAIFMRIKSFIPGMGA